MIENEINELFAILGKDRPIDTNLLRDIFQKICPNQEVSKRSNEPVTKEMMVSIFNQGMSENNVEERLFFIFYNLDQGKKGYLSPEDIKFLFKSFGQQVSLNDVQNSFRYAKLAQNRMSFQDFKEHFLKF